MRSLMAKSKQPGSFQPDYDESDDEEMPDLSSKVDSDSGEANTVRSSNC